MNIRRRMMMAGVAGITLAGLGFTFAPLFLGQAETSAAIASAYASYAIPQADYSGQRVVYHVVNRGHWRDRTSEAWRLVHVLNNHITAVAPDDVELRVIFQGDGIDALLRAKKHAELGLAFDRLRARGVKFHVCMTTAISYRILPEAMHNVSATDFIQTSVVEVARLQKEGFGYIRF